MPRCARIEYYQLRRGYYHLVKTKGDIKIFAFVIERKSVPQRTKTGGINMRHAAHKTLGITVVVSALFYLTGCTGWYVDPDLIISLAKLSNETDKYNTLSDLQKFYLSGQDSSETMNGLRIISNIESNRIIDISRISFSNEVWGEYYYDNDVTSKRLHDFFNKIDNADIVLPGSTPKTIQFNATQFRELIEKKRTVLTKVTIYEEGFMAMYTERDKTIALIPFGKGNYQSLRECFNGKR